MFVLNFFAFFFSGAFFVRFSNQLGQNGRGFFLFHGISGMISTLILIAMIAVITGRVFSTCMMLVTAPIFVLLAQKMKNFCLIKQVNANKLTFLRLLILKMSAGESFRRAIDHACEHLDQKTCHIYKTIVENCAAGNCNTNVNFEMRDVERLILMGLAKKQDVRGYLAVYKQKLEIENKLRNKIKSATAQIYAQIACLLFMYLAILFYTFWQYGFWRYQKLTFISSTLIFAGLVWSYIMAKGFRWKM